MTADTETAKIITETFKYSFPTCTNENVLFKLEVPIEIPHDGSTRELVQRVINMFHIPVYLEDGTVIFFHILCYQDFYILLVPYLSHLQDQPMERKLTKDIQATRSTHFCFG